MARVSGEQRGGAREYGKSREGVRDGGRTCWICGAVNKGCVVNVVVDRQVYRRV